MRIIRGLLKQHREIVFYVGGTLLILAIYPVFYTFFFIDRFDTTVVPAKPEDFAKVTPYGATFIDNNGRTTIILPPQRDLGLTTDGSHSYRLGDTQKKSVLPELAPSLVPDKVKDDMESILH